MSLQQQSPTTLKFPKPFSDYADEVLYLLVNRGPQAGRELRAALNEGKTWFWQRWSTAGFYKLMSDLEDAGIVQFTVDCHIEGFDDYMLHPRHRIYNPAEIDNVAGKQVLFTTAFGKPQKGTVSYQEGHKLFINWLNPNLNIMQAVRFAHKVLLTGK
jgi:hypothetical protein